MLRPVSRRAVVGSLGAALTQPLWRVSDQAAAQSNEPLSCYIDESGRRGETLLVIGFLTVANPAAHYRFIEDLRTQISYQRILQYRSTDRHKADFVKPLVAYFAANPDLKFSAVIASDEQQRWPTLADERDSLYFGFYKDLITAGIPQQIRAITVRAENRTKTGRDRLLQKYLVDNLRPRSAFNVVQAGEDDLIQLTGFLTGCIYCELTKPSVKLKLDMLDHVKSVLRVPSLAQARIPNKFSARKLSI